MKVGLHVGFDGGWMKFYPIIHRGGSLYKIFVQHVRRRGICLGAIYLQGMN
jgi:hypothetical protein